MNPDIKKTVTAIQRKFETSDPFKIADALHIQTTIGDIGTREGCYMYLKRHKCIFLNEKLEEYQLRFVMAHELGHAIMHPRENCYFIRNKTLLSNSRRETEANKFAMELLLPDDTLLEYMKAGFTTEQVARMTGYCQKLIELRMN